MQDEDLRTWIQAVDDLGELERFDGASWDLELAAISEIALRERRPPPALLFDHIVDYPPGFRVLNGLLNSPRRTALTLGLGADLDSRRLVQAWRQRLRTLEPIAPRLVERGPILENEQRAAAIDLWQFPTPKWHEEDGGRYLGTACAVMTRDPDTGWINS